MASPAPTSTATSTPNQFTMELMQKFQQHAQLQQLQQASTGAVLDSNNNNTSQQVRTQPLATNSISNALNSLLYAHRSETMNGGSGFFHPPSNEMEPSDDTIAMGADGDGGGNDHYSDSSRPSSIDSATAKANLASTLLAISNGTSASKMQGSTHKSDESFNNPEFAPFAGIQHGGGGLEEGMNMNGMVARGYKRAAAKEKKKFTPEVSDHLVMEVIKRKELLVENNTSRDLTFSENKRAAWLDVQHLLRTHHTGFNQDIEAIKSHWRYRKRKVTDAWAEVKSVEEMVAKVGTGTDYEIYLMLRESNLLEQPPRNGSQDGKLGSCSTTTPSDGEEGHCGHGTPMSLSTSMATSHPVPASLATTAPNNQLPLIAPFIDALYARQNMMINAAQQNPLSTAMGLPNATGGGAGAGQLEKLASLLMEVNKASLASAMSASGNGMPSSGTHLPLAEGNGPTGASISSSLSASGNFGNGATRRKRSRKDWGWLSSSLKTEEGQHVDAMDAEPAREKKVEGQPEGVEQCQRAAFEAQRVAFEQLSALIGDVKKDLLPKLLIAVENFNRHYGVEPSSSRTNGHNQDETERSGKESSDGEEENCH